MIVRVQDCQEIGFCMKSVRPWFKRHDLDFVHFVDHGIESEKLLATDDAFAQQIVEHVAKRDGTNG